MSEYFIVYDDMVVHDGRDGPPPSALGVQVVVQTHPDVGWHTQSGYDFYIKRGGRWVGVDRAGLFEELVRDGRVLFDVGLRHKIFMGDRWVPVDEFGLYKWVADSGIALFGRTLTTSDFHKAMAVAMKIRRVMKEKSGWLSGEK